MDIEKEVQVSREVWLQRGITVFRDMFVKADSRLPDKIYVSTGFAHGVRYESKKIMGQTWSGRASEDGYPHVFISPELGDTYDVIETLIHELVHVADDNRSGHRGEFAEIAARLGLVAPFSYSPAGPALQAELLVIAAELGTYPHAALHPTGIAVVAPVGPNGEVVPTKVHSGPAKQSGRLRKVSCQVRVGDKRNGDQECGYTARVTRKWLDKGSPLCPIHQVPMTEES